MMHFFPMGAQPSKSVRGDTADTIKLQCWIKGEDTPFQVEIEMKDNIHTLKSRIREECKHGSLRTVDAKDLELRQVWQIAIDTVSNWNMLGYNPLIGSSQSRRFR
jgi:hypothetical protein